jgi:hypothetical protein
MGKSGGFFRQILSTGVGFRPSHYPKAVFAIMLNLDIGDLPSPFQHDE